MIEQKIQQTGHFSTSIAFAGTYVSFPPVLTSSPADWVPLALNVHFSNAGSALRVERGAKRLCWPFLDVADDHASTPVTVLGYPLDQMYKRPSGSCGPSKLVSWRSALSSIGLSKRRWLHRRLSAILHLIDLITRRECEFVLQVPTNLRLACHFQIAEGNPTYHTSPHILSLS